MIGIFKELVASIQDMNYGQKITEMETKKVVIYWTKWVVLVTAVSTFLILSAVVYLTPQAKKILTEKLPNVSFSVKNGRISSDNINEPFVYGNGRMAIILDPKERVENLDKYENAFLLSGEKYITKQNNMTQNLKIRDNFPDFDYSKDEILLWVNKNQDILLFVGILVSVLLSLFMGIFTWVYKTLGFVIFSAIAFLFVKYFYKKEIKYINLFKIVVYASILPFLFSALGILSPSGIMDMISWGIFVFYLINWLKKTST